jgi:hypothetical protein
LVVQGHILVVQGNIVVVNEVDNLVVQGDILIYLLLLLNEVVVQGTFWWCKETLLW